MQIQKILEAFGFNHMSVKANYFGNGLINNTWLVTNENNHYILQRVNHNVFKKPYAIAANIDNIGNYLTSKFPAYLFTKPISTTSGGSLLFVEDMGYFRLFNFVKDSHSKDVLETPEQAYEAAKQFGKFTSLLNEFNVESLQETIPNFHNLSLRQDQFLYSLKNGNQERIKETALFTKTLLKYEDIVTTYKKIKSNINFKLRVTHHDTKISNVLFDNNNKGQCVIDLDTVMQGYFISDVGDMMRTYLSPVSEEEKDFSKIEIRDEFYNALVNGYFEEMKDVLTETEQNYFFYAGTFIIYMQAIRFITDYLNNDIYYGSKYHGQNLIRANNQAVLLQRLIEKKEKLAHSLSIKKIYA